MWGRSRRFAASPCGSTRADPKFKPLRDAVHNQISAGLIPQLEAYRNGLPQGSTRTQTDELIAEITKLTAVDTRALQSQVAEIQDAALRAQLSRATACGDRRPD